MRKESKIMPEKHAAITKTKSGYVMVDPRKVKLAVDSDGKSLNPRRDLQLDELKAFIKNSGGTKVLPPIDLQLHNGDMILVHGHRRLQATLELIEQGESILDMPAIIHDSKEFLTDDKILFRNITQNQGLPLSAIEQGEGIKRLVGYGWQQNEIARLMGKSAAWVTQILETLKASEVLKEAYDNKEITTTELRELAKVGSDVSDPLLKEEKQKQALEQKKAHKAERAIKQGTGSQGGKRGRPSLPSKKSSTATASTNGTASTATNPPKQGSSVKVSTGNASALHDTVNKTLTDYSLQDLMRSIQLWDKNTNKGIYNVALEPCINYIRRIDTGLNPVNPMAKQPVQQHVSNGQALTEQGSVLLGANITVTNTATGESKTADKILANPLPDRASVLPDTTTAVENPVMVTVDDTATVEPEYVTLILLADDKAKVKKSGRGKPAEYSNVKYSGSKKVFTALDNKGNKTSFPLTEKFSAKKKEYRINAEHIVSSVA